jgi:hypothetical protein
MASSLGIIFVDYITQQTFQLLGKEELRYSKIIIRPEVFEILVDLILLWKRFILVSKV